jgi:hypothetical protein
MGSPASALEAVAELGGKLQGELHLLVQWRWRLERELGGNYHQEVGYKRRMLELVMATQEQLATQRSGQSSSVGEGSRASTQVRGPAKCRTSVDPDGPPGACVHGVTAHASGATLKRSHPTSLDAKPQPQPLPTRALPEALWEDHLLPLLTCKDAARLGCTCKALRAVVHEHFRGDLGTFELDLLRAALTTFPRARRVTLTSPDDERDTDEIAIEALVQWLRDERRGQYLAIVESQGQAAYDFTYKALLEGALPSLQGVDLDMDDEAARALLSEGFLGGISELYVIVNCVDEPQRAALGLLRQLPALTKLHVLSCFTEGDEPLQWPPCIPPSLKALFIDDSCQPVACLMLRALPATLEASGARLQRLEVLLPSELEAIGDGLVHLAQVLRCCSPTLKGFRLDTAEDVVIGIESGNEDYAEEVERLRVQWAGVMAGVSACREFQVLVLPDIEVEPLFPPGTAFGRLTQLEISDYEREHPPDAGVMGLWELMASGGLPALTKLRVRLHGRWGGWEEVRSRMARAFEAVAGILTHLHLEKFDQGLGWVGDEVKVSYELGAAMGQLRRLKDLALDLSHDGQAYHAIAQGLAASGGGCPLPLLRRLMISSDFRANADLVASLLLRVCGFSA